MEPNIILGRAFMEQTRSMVNYQLGAITLWAEIDVEVENGISNAPDEEEEIPKSSEFSLDTKRKPPGSYKLSDIMSPGHFTA